MTTTTPEQERDEARTPPSLFKELDDIYHFDCDAAANDYNSLCGDDWLQSALLDSWAGFGYKSLYCNPPYSRGSIDKFIKKSYEESLNGATVVMLLPMDSSTNWFHNYAMKAQRWILFHPRVRFLRPSGVPFEGSPKFGSFACVFDEVGRRSQSGVLVDSMRWKD